MYYCYGAQVSSIGKIPAASDTAACFGVFTAGSKHVVVTGGTYYGGDSNEAYTIALVPPMFPLDGSMGSGTDADDNGMIILNPNLDGGVHNGARAGSIYLNLGGSTGILATQAAPAFWIVPPFWNIVAFANTATNTTAVTVKIMGYELDKP